MSVPLAYLGVILIWATTPLAIKWSGEGPGFLFGVTARMAVAALLALTAARLSRTPLLRGRNAVSAYFTAGLGIYGAMLSTYWAAQHIPSGWVSVVFGLAPILTGIVASVCLANREVTALRVLGAATGIAGLAVIFGRGGTLNASAVHGLAAVFLAVLFHSVSAVCVKRFGTGVPPLAMVAGGLSVATPLFLLTWSVFDGGWPDPLPFRAAGSILYLAVIGSLIGFALYFYVLGHVDATRVALITLITPIAALMLGHFLNGEPLTVAVLAGAGLVIAGLALFEFGDRMMHTIARGVRQPT